MVGIKKINKSCLTLLKSNKNPKSLVDHFDWVKQIFNELPLSIIVLDKKGKIVLTNKFHDELTGHLPESKLGIDLLKSSSFKKKSGIIRKYKKLLKDGEPFTVNDFFVKKDNNPYHIGITTLPISDSAGKIYGAISIGSDITELKLLENKLKNANKNLSEKVTQKTKELRQALKFKDEFLAEISHELRTPLAIIKGNIDLLMKYNSSFKKLEELQLISEEIDRMTELISNLTTLSDINSVHDKLNSKPTDLTQLLFSIKKNMDIIAGAKKININIYAKKNLRCNLDREKIKKAIQNLISNAIKYGNKNGYVNICAQKNKDILKITIEDNGIGITKKELPHIFERLYRTEKSRSRDTGGSGLGLAIVEHIICLHGGKIDVKSQSKKGTKFIMEIPNQ